MTITVTWVDTTTKTDNLSKFEKSSPRERKINSNKKRRFKPRRPTLVKAIDEKKVLRCIGYLPENRKHFIDREINGVKFCFYSYYINLVEDYVRGKARAKNRGYI